MFKNKKFSLLFQFTFYINFIYVLKYNTQFIEIYFSFHLVLFVVKLLCFNAYANMYIVYTYVSKFFSHIR